VGLLFIAGRDPSTSVGGHSRYVEAHARAAQAAGFAPEIFCVDAGKPAVEAEYGRIHRVHSPVPIRRHPFMLAHEPFLSAAIGKYAQDQPGPHLLHSFGPWAFVGFRAQRRLERMGLQATAVASAYTTLRHDWAAKLRGLSRRDGAGKWVRYRAEYLWIQAIAGPRERQGYGGSRLVLVNYESVRHLLEADGVRSEIRRLPYAASSAFASEPDAQQEPTPEPLARLEPSTAPLLVVVARHDPRKGLGLLIDCLADLQKEGVPFRACFVGPGTLLAPHRAQVLERGLGGRVSVPGWVEDPGVYLRKADLFVLPSLEEGSGSVALLEALHAGCAVVASRCDGIPEDLTDGESALLVEPGNALALTGALRRALLDGELRQRLARAARRTSDERFGRSGLIAALSAVYAELGLVA
jgi:glycosyltransferase involved in cell wall biosynthesis